MAPLSDDRDRSFDKALARHFRSAAHSQDSVAPQGCADAETLAAYHDGGLSPEEVHLWSVHLKECARCQTILSQLAATAAVPFAATAQAAKPEAAGVHVFKPRRTALWRWAAPAGALAAALLVWVAVRQSEPIKVTDLRKDAASAAKMPEQKLSQTVAPGANQELTAQLPAAGQPVSGSLKPKRESRAALFAKTSPKPVPPSGAPTSQNALDLYADKLEKSDSADKGAGAREFRQAAPAFVSPAPAPPPSAPAVSSSAAAVS